LHEQLFDGVPEHESGQEVHGIKLGDIAAHLSKHNRIY
jgi:hypothetical protein